MLLEAYLSHLKKNPRSPLRRIPFERCLDDRAIWICLANLAWLAQRKRDQNRGNDRPALELT